MCINRYCHCTIILTGLGCEFIEERCNNAYQCSPCCNSHIQCTDYDARAFVRAVQCMYVVQIVTAMPSRGIVQDHVYMTVVQL